MSSRQGWARAWLRTIAWLCWSAIAISACGNHDHGTGTNSAGGLGGGTSLGGNSSGASVGAGGTGRAEAGSTGTRGGEMGAERGGATSEAGGEAGAGAGGASSEPTLPQCASPLDRTVPSTMYAIARCLFEGSDAPQQNLHPSTISAERVTIVRGRVLDATGAPLAGATVSVSHHPEFGSTLSRSDGYFDLAINGGGFVTVHYELAGYLSAQRHLETQWRTFALFPDVVLLPLPDSATSVDLETSAPNVIEGALVQDDRGARRTVAIIAPNTKATLVFADGSKQPISKLHTRVQEFTVGERGPQAMPADLPATTGYTYAAAFTVDEATKAHAASVEFDPPVAHYVENFLDFPIGWLAPNGYYDADSDVWRPGPNGVVLRIVAIEGGIAALDTDGDGQAESADTLATLGITTDELSVLGSRYEVGQSLWRAPTPHFSIWDINWGLYPPDDAISPDSIFDSNTDCQGSTSGSIIGCEGQTLGEDLPLSGTPFSLHYQSERTQGRADTRQVTLQLTGPNVPTDAGKMIVIIEVAGRSFRQDLSILPNEKYTFTWDGKDAYGRVLQGKQPLVAEIGYDYPSSVYKEGLGWGYDNGGNVTGSKASQNLVLWTRITTSIGTAGVEPLELGGWTLSANHIYDSYGHTLYLGSGPQRTARGVSSDEITSVVGPGDSTETARGDGGPATLAYVSKPRSVAVAGDGSLFVAEGNFVRKVTPDGVISTYAGNALGPPATGDGGRALDAAVPSPVSLALGPDGTLYIAGYYQVRAVSPDGIIRTVAGSGQLKPSGDGGPALDAGVDPSAIALGPDGSLYIAEASDCVVRRVDTAGIISRFAGNGQSSVHGLLHGDEGISGLAATIGAVSGVAVDRDGNVFITAAHPDAVRKIAPTGIITTVAGFNTHDRDEGSPAAGISVLYPSAPAVAPDGSLVFANSSNSLLMVRPDGKLHIVVDNSSSHSDGSVGDLGPADRGYLNGIPGATTFGPDGTIYIADTQANRIRRVSPALPGFAFTSTIVPSVDARLLYVFDSSGRHLSTIDALTKTKLLSFSYDDAGRLTSVVDQFGNTTNIVRTATGALDSIVGPYGESTQFTIDANGYLASLTNANQETTSFQFSSLGLLQSIAGPRAATDVHSFTYDKNGRLTRDTEPNGSYKDLTRSYGSGSAYNVTIATALGRSETHAVNDPNPDTIQRTLTDSAGIVTTLTSAGGTNVVKTPARTTTAIFGGDPRFGISAPIVESQSIQLSGMTTSSTIAQSRHVSLANPGDPFSVTALTEALTVNGDVWRSDWDANTLTFTSTSPEGRVEKRTVNALAEVVSVQHGNLAATSFAYDAQGRVTSITSDDRTTSFTYDSSGRLASTTNALAQTAVIARDPVGRPLKLTLPDSAQLSSTFDANDNVQSLTPPGQPAHSFNYGPGDLLLSYNPPKLNGKDFSTSYSYDKDGQNQKISLPSGTNIAPAYDKQTGRITSLTAGDDITSFDYDATTGFLQTVTAGNEVLSFGYTGDHLTKTTWSGEVNGSVATTLDTSLRPATEAVGASVIRLAYDRDNLLTSAGDELLMLDPTNGLINGTELGHVTDTLTYNSHGESLSYAATTTVTSTLFSLNYSRDALGRIVGRQEAIQGETHADEYAYDSRGRLTSVTRDGKLLGSYGYDANDNITSVTDANGSRSRSYDAQDRLLTNGSATFTYTPEGALLSKTNGTKTTHYTYDLLGALRSVTLPDTTVIDYVIDGSHRRIGKKVNGTLRSAYLYRNGLNVVAELDGAGALVSRFVYASRITTPDYMVRGNATYRILSDERGSVRLVVDATTGAVAQRIDYDPWGVVTADTNPGFQPFGFAGGLYDADTGLVRFGARDYDPVSARWTQKDPLRFGGGDANLYAYAGDDPVNRIDPDGHFATIIAGAAIGAAMDLGGQLLGNGGNWDCVNWGEVALMGALGAVGGALAAEMTVAEGAEGACADGMCPCFVSGTRVDSDSGGNAIEETELGTRVGPELDSCAAPELSQWREVDLLMTVDNDGALDELELRLLRPESWIRETGAREGHVIDIALDDLNVAGHARVTNVGSAGHVAPGYRCPVTGWVRHTSHDVIPVTIDENETLMVTRHHRLFSADRGDWVHAGDLRIGELLETRHGLAQVTSVGTGIVAPVEVFNLEVFATHRYFVGEHEVLAHNMYEASLEEALAARDKLSAELAQTRHPPATVVGAYSKSTGGVTAGASRGGGLGCAEGVCFESLGKPADIQFTPAVRPRTGEMVPVCPICEATWGRGAFPDPTTVFKSDLEVSL